MTNEKQIINLDNIKELVDICWSLSEHLFKLIAWGVLVVAGRVFITNEHSDISWVNMPLTVIWLIAVFSANFKAMIYLMKSHPNSVAQYKAAHERLFPNWFKPKYGIIISYILVYGAFVPVCYYYLSYLDGVLELIIPKGGLRHIP
ncbi:hypothetical protein [Azospirillum argentinense]